MPRLGRFVLGCAWAAWALAACKDDGVSPAETGELVVRASAQVPTPASVEGAAGPAAVPIGAPSSWRVGLYEFHISMNADCAPPFVQAYSSGAAPSVQDFVTSPVLFTATGLPVGSYPCVAMKITDVMEFESGVSSGACVSGTTYVGDVYPAGEDPFFDLSLSAIPSTGSDAAPSEDGIFLLFSTARTSAVARGFASNQVIPLASPLVIPDDITFYWDASNAVNDTGTSCNLEPDAPALFW
jgi:hypothetical protein